MSDKQDDVEKQIDRWWSEYCGSVMFVPLAKAELLRIVNEARIDELKNVQLQHGHYMTQTWVNNEHMTIEERIATLSTTTTKEGESA